MHHVSQCSAPCRSLLLCRGGQKNTKRQNLHPSANGVAPRANSMVHPTAKYSHPSAEIWSPHRPSNLHPSAKIWSPDRPTDLHPSAKIWSPHRPRYLHPSAKIAPPHRPTNKTHSPMHGTPGVSSVTPGLGQRLCYVTQFLSSNFVGKTCDTQ